MLHSSIAHCIICTRLFRGKMHSDWFNGIEILQGRWQHGEKVGYSYPSGVEKTLFKWDIYVPLVTKGKVLHQTTFCYAALHTVSFVQRLFRGKLHSDWFNRIEILQGRWQHGDKVRYCYPSGFKNKPL